MRKKLVLDFWDRSRILTLKNKEYKKFVQDLVFRKLNEDIGKGDLTSSSLIPKNKKIKAKVISKQNGVIAGIDESLLLFKNFNIKKYKRDGNKIKNKDVILEIYGNARKILSRERTFLNILQRMSGIATLTFNLNKIIKNNCFIVGTRKTLFGLMDKRAISLGKGLTHRLNLSDGIIIKDNHLKVLKNDIEKALLLASKSKTKYIEIEVKNEKEALKAAEIISKLKSKKLFAIMFDNMAPLEIKSSIIKIENKYNTDNILFEASGNINDKNIKEYAESGIDAASSGFLTHSVKALNISMEIE